MSKKWLNWALGIGSVIVITIVIWLLVVGLGSDLGPPLDVSTEPPPTTVPPVTQPPPPPPLASNCGQSGFWDLLVLAYDNKIEPPFGADAIRVVRVNFSAQTIQVVALPRDLWVQTPALAANNVQAATLGAVFQHRLESATGSSQEVRSAAVNAMAQTIYDNFGLTGDHYLLLEMPAFATMVDTIGGVELEVPQALTSGDQTFNPGAQQLNGAQALIYVRALGKEESEEARQARQNLVLRAIRARVLSPSVLPKVPDLVNQFYNSILTDMNPVELASLACMLDKVPSSEVKFHEIKGNMVSPGPDRSLIPNVPSIQEYLKSVLPDS